MNISWTLSAISLALLDQVQTEHDLKRLTRQYVDHGRRILFERHRAGADGLEIVSAWSTVMDHLIRHLFTQISAEHTSQFSAPNLRFDSGRSRRLWPGRAQSPVGHRSLISLPGKSHPSSKSVTEKLLYTLWDAGLQVGHATRSIVRVHAPGAKAT